LVCTSGRPFVLIQVRVVDTSLLSSEESPSKTGTEADPEGGDV